MLYMSYLHDIVLFFFFQAEDGIRDLTVTGVQTCAFRSLSAGVPLERAVASSEAVARGALRETLAAARTRLHEGYSFAQALGAGQGVVPGIVLGMLRAGERGSQLPLALEQVAKHLEQEAELVARVRQALAYPLLLAVVGVASVLVIGTVIVPRFADLLGDLGQELPPATRMLLVGSSLLSHYWFLLIPAVAGLVPLGVEVTRRPVSRRRNEGAPLAAPPIGAVRLALPTSRLTPAAGRARPGGGPPPGPPP